MSLGEVLKRARNARGLSLRDAERETGISNGYLSQLESDNVRQPSPHHLHKLADLYGQDYAELMQLAGYVIPGPPTPRPHPAVRSLMVAASDLTDDEARRVAEYIDLLRAARRAQE